MARRNSLSFLSKIYSLEHVKGPLFDLTFGTEKKGELLTIHRKEARLELIRVLEGLIGILMVTPKTGEEGLVSKYFKVLQNKQHFPKSEHS